MKKNLVTVVTVTYNAQDLLEKTILSVLDQTYSNIEYIIIDGGSADNTVDIIKKYEDKISYWVSEPDEGIYFAMNKAIVKATGKWINFMNAGDTFVDSSTVQKVMENVNENTDLVYGDHVSDGIVSSVKACRVTRQMPCCHQSLFVKTSLMKKNPFNTFYKIPADYEFVLNMYQTGKTFQYIEMAVANYLRNGFSDQNTIRWYLEVLTIMMNNHVELDEIVASSAYQLLTNRQQIQQNENINKSLKEELQKEQKKLRQSIKEFDALKEKYDSLTKNLSDICNIQTWKTPFKKIRAYKKLLSLYHSL